MNHVIVIDDSIMISRRYCYTFQTKSLIAVFENFSKIIEKPPLEERKLQLNYDYIVFDDPLNE